METGLQEAKILDENEPEPVDSTAVELVPDNDTEDLIELDDHPEPEDNPEDSIIRQNIKAAAGAPVQDHSELSTSLAVVKNYKTTDISNLTSALESLADLAHEIDFGSRIMDTNNLPVLLSIVQDKQTPLSVQEIAVRVIGASLRNNPDALKHALGFKVTKTLLDALDNQTTVASQGSLAADPASNKLAGRLIYALGSLVSSGEGDPEVYGEADREYFTYHGGNILRRAFVTGGPDVKRKGAVFVADRALTASWPVEELREWSTIFQKEISAGKLDSSTQEVVLEALVKMHEFAIDPVNEQQVLKKRDHTTPEEELPVEDDFLNWLASEADSNGHSEYLSEIKRVRHQVFGNPLASRKAFDDL